MRIAGTLEYMPELRFTPSGKCLCTFQVNTDLGVVVNCEMWEDLAEEFSDLGLQPGTRVGLLGGLRTRRYNDKAYKYFVVHTYAAQS